MSDIATQDLKTEIHAILKNADLTIVSAKAVRQEVEKKLNCSLTKRKKEFDSIVMDFLNEQQQLSDQLSEPEESASGVDASSDDDEKHKPKKRQQPMQRKAAPKKKKRKSIATANSGSDSNGGSDSDFEIPKKVAAKKKSGGAAKTTGRKSTGFTRAYNLSPELAALMGAEALPRHEVVKKVWAIIKERDLYDPKNKQFAICDDELFKVMKVKRFRTFGMLKHLKPHFLA